MVLGLMAFGAAIGTLAAQKGFSLGQTVAMSGLVYAGTAQFAALQAWPEQMTLATIASLMLLTATVNLRFLLMGISLRPWFGRLPGWQTYPSLLLVTDGNWLLALRYYAKHPMDIGFFVASSVLNWVAFVVGTIPGYLLASWLSDPRRFGLDVIVPAFFAALLVPIWKGHRQTIAWVVAGLVAILAERSLTGGFLHERE
jgi:4-azaleucine resistance transporter AzlC